MPSSHKHLCGLSFQCALGGGEWKLKKFGSKQQGVFYARRSLPFCTVSLHLIVPTARVIRSTRSCSLSFAKSWLLLPE